MGLRCNLEMKLTGLGKGKRAEHLRRGMRMEVGEGGRSEHPPSAERLTSGRAVALWLLLNH